MNDPAGWTLCETAAAIAAREVSSREVVESLLERIRTWQPVTNAFVAVLAEQALAAAIRADDAIVAGRELGALHGVPLAHKDMFYRSGRHSTLGSKAASNLVPATDSTVLRRLDAAGAIEIGTLNMCEFALGPTGHNAWLGAVRNPWNPAHIACGSSSGGGAAVAARMAYGSFGTDTGGSVRLPASATGVLGLKPTHGRMSRHGMMALSPSVDVPGIFARSARDVARLMQVTAGFDPGDARCSRRPVDDYESSPGLSIRGLRVGVPTNYFLEQVSEDVSRALEASLQVLRDAGARIASVEVPHPEHLAQLSRAIVYSEATALHSQMLQERAGDYAPQVRVRAATGMAIPAPTYLQALALRAPLARAFVEQVFTKCDVLHLPTLGIAVPTLEETDVGSGSVMWEKIALLVRCSAAFNYLGLPALSVPCGFTEIGLPTSFQLAVRPFAEARLLQVAGVYESATDWLRREPIAPSRASVASSSAEKPAS